MQTIIQNYLKEAKIGRKQSHRNLAIFPLLSSYAIAWTTSRSTRPCLKS